MIDIIRVAQIRIVPAKGDLDGNSEVLRDVLARISEHRPDVVVTPECFLDGYVATEDYVTEETITSYAIDPESSQHSPAAAEWASSNRAWVIFGCTRLGDGCAYNSALAYNRDGQLAGIYDKTHCQTHDRKFHAGDGLPVFESDFGPFGVMICADRRWPETVRTLAIGGARIIFNPTYGMHDDRNLHMMQTRSYESEVFIAFTHPEQSLVTGPSGEVVVDERSPDSGFTICEVNLAEADRARASESCHLRDRRPELYLL